MDREIDIRERRSRLRRRVLIAAVCLAGAAVILAVAADRLRPSVRRAEIRVAAVERGSFEATVQASGTLVPASERVLSSPAESRVVRVLRRTGERVTAGDPILELDTGEMELKLDGLSDRLAQNASDQLQQQVEYEDKVAGLESDIEIQKLDLEIARYKLDQARRLDDDGLVSEEQMKQAEAAVRRAEIELQRSRDAVVSSGRGQQAAMRRLELDAELLRKDKRELERELELATTRSPVDGVLTWVADEVGSTVGAGAVVARIADLRSYRVEATVADAYASRLEAGQPVRVPVDDETLNGTVASIRPTIESGVLTFDVTLERSDHPDLRHNLRVDVLVVTDRKQDALLAPRGPYIQGGGVEHQVFVVRGDRAYRTDVRLGQSGHRFFEVLAGLQEGDEVILSDMRSSLHARELRVR